MVAGERNGAPYATATDATDVMKNGSSRSVCLATNTYKCRWWVSQIRTLAVEPIGGHLGMVTPEELAQVIEGLSEIIGD